jgi:hypothetical protein
MLVYGQKLRICFVSWRRNLRMRRVVGRGLSGQVESQKKIIELDSAWAHRDVDDKLMRE